MLSHGRSFAIWVGLNKIFPMSDNKIFKVNEAWSTNALINVEKYESDYSKSFDNNEEYFTTARFERLPKASIIPIGKQKIREKNETMKVKDKPPHAPVSTHSKPNSPPEIK